MKNPKSSGGKGSSHKGLSSCSSAADNATGGRKSRWKSAAKPPSDAKHSKSKEDPAGPSASPSVPHKDYPAVPPAASDHVHPLPATGPPFPHPDPVTSPLAAPLPYGFHNLERRTIALADGSVRSYFALPPGPTAESAADKMFPYGPGVRPGFGHGQDSGLGLAFVKRFPPQSGRLSPEDLREPPYGRGLGPQHDYRASLGFDDRRAPPEGAESSLKRKYKEEDDFAWHRQHVMQYGNPSANPDGLLLGSCGDRKDNLGRTGGPLRPDHDDLRSSKQAKLGGEGYEDLPLRRAKPDDVPAVALAVDPQALKRAFLRMSKTINESSTQRKNYLEDGKNGPLKCIVCSRTRF